jgi:hypothetical protein
MHIFYFYALPKNGMYINYVSVAGHQMGLAPFVQWVLQRKIRLTVVVTVEDVSLVADAAVMSHGSTVDDQCFIELEDCRNPHAGITIKHVV